MKIKYVVIACAALILLPLAVAHGVFRASLPKLDGDFHHMGVVAMVTIDRDALGVPTIEAANRVDLAYGTGFVHGQDRFFEMDLSRRLAAGELSEVFGAVAVEQDKKARLFRFRRVARESLQLATPEQRAVLEAYARGVNAGLASLRSRPWEYWLFRSVPVEWRPEDTMLVSHAMWWDLQYGGVDREIMRQQVNARLGGPECEAGWKCVLKFFYPAGTEWDAPNAPVGLVNAGPVGGTDAAPAGSLAVNPPVPPPDILNIRGSPVAASPTASAAGASPTASSPPLHSPDAGIGSNNWAVAGRLTATGAALIANDMHLRARVPAVWYRARLRVKASDTQPAIDLNGVTLPGAPVLVAGSNGNIAWGFTNSYGNWLRVEQAPCGSATTVQQEEIRVHDQPSVSFPVKSSPAGVLYKTGADGSCWFVTWLAQQPASTNMNLALLERTTSVAQALAVAPTLGIPHQNFVVGDREGHIAWTIAGRIPVGIDASRVLGSPKWTTAETHPHILDPEVGRIWTANARQTDDPDQLATLGANTASIGVDFDLGARAHQIRDDLLAIKEKATPADMLRIQLDDRAQFLTRWRGLIVGLLDADATANQPERARFKQLVSDWTPRAGVDSVGYRLVRAFHDQAQQSAWDMVRTSLRLPSEADPWPPEQFEGALWRLVNERPMHLLAANFTDWHQFLLGQVDATLRALKPVCPQLDRCTWGARNPVHIQHPLSRAVPLLSSLLDMPKVELPGDHDMPRVQDGPIGASERFAVSPGHEDQGYIHIPGGQSGHPLSPFYKAGFMDWANGTPTPFLPGDSQHRLTLQPE